MKTKIVDKRINEKKVIIVCDDLNIGGIQRLTLDQAFQLSDLGKNVIILVLSQEPHSIKPSFFNMEKELLTSKRIEVRHLAGHKKKQFKELFQFSKNTVMEIIISHSLRASVMFSAVKFFTSGNYIIVTTIHQLLSMSAPVQRIRRLFYSQFTDILFGFSNALIQDWHTRRKNNPFIKVLTYKRKITLCRNGVYLPRLSLPNEEFPKRQKRLIFIGRVTAWKGISTFLELANHHEFKQMELMLVTPTDPAIFVAENQNEALRKITLQIGKSVSDIEFTRNDFHIYPANYGPKSKFSEGVSINVLEMACLGVPSVITFNGNFTWPELFELGLVVEVSWADMDSVSSIILKQISNQEIPQYDKARELIDIRNNLNQIFATAKVDLQVNL